MGSVISLVKRCRISLQGDQPWLWWVLGAFGGGDDREQGVGEHREQGPAPPCQPAAELVLIEPG